MSDLRTATDSVVLRSGEPVYNGQHRIRHLEAYIEEFREDVGFREAEDG